MIKKLRLKLVIAAMLSLFLVLTVIVGTANIFNYRRIYTDADRTLSILADNNGQFPENIFAPGNKPDKKQHLSPELPYESRYFTVIMSSNETATAINTGKIAAVDTSTAIAYAQEVMNTGHSSGFLHDYRYMVYTEDSETHIIFLDCGRGMGNLRTFLLTSAGVALAGLLAVLLLLTILSERIVKPFAENYEKQKRFITDAGHELKTPLTIIDADATVLEMDLEDNEWIHDIKAQTKRLTDLTNDLIFLARAEEEQPQLELIPLPLSDIVEETAESFLAPAKLRGKTFSCKIQPMITLTGDEKSIRKLISILLDNAMKYSNENGTIILELTQQKHQLHLSVYNTVETISKSHLEHLFDRFYRTDASRNSKTGGYGLGLSIASAIVVAHHGKISATTEDEKSLRICVTFPI